MAIAEEINGDRLNRKIELFVQRCKSHFVWGSIVIRGQPTSQPASQAASSMQLSIIAHPPLNSWQLLLQLDMWVAKFVDLFRRRDNTFAELHKLAGILSYLQFSSRSSFFWERSLSQCWDLRRRGICLERVLVTRQVRLVHRRMGIGRSQAGDYLKSECVGNGKGQQLLVLLLLLKIKRSGCIISAYEWVNNNIVLEMRRSQGSSRGGIVRSSWWMGSLRMKYFYQRVFIKSEIFKWRRCW